MWHSRPPRDPPPFMANAILNFHFDFPHPSLIKSLLFQALYEFVYRAISDYVDLYRNKDEEYEYSVPVGAVNNSGTTKSVKSVQSAKSNGSGPYCVPVGSNNTGKSSGSGSS